MGQVHNVVIFYPSSSNFTTHPTQHSQLRIISL